DRLAGMPGRVVDEDNYPGILVLRVAPAEPTQVAGEGTLQPAGLALARLAIQARAALQGVGVQGAGDDVDRGEDVQLVLVVPGAHHRPVALDAERAAQGRHHREA